MNVAKQGSLEQVQYVGLFKDGVPMTTRPEGESTEFGPDSVRVDDDRRLAGKLVAGVEARFVSADPWSGDPNRAQHDAGGEG